MSLVLELQVSRIEKVLKYIQHEIVKILTKLLDNGESSQIEKSAKCIEDYLHQIKDKIASGEVVTDHHDHDQVGLTSNIPDFNDDFMDIEDITCDGIIIDEVKPDVHSISIDNLTQECLNKRTIVELERLPILQIISNENLPDEQHSISIQKLVQECLNKRAIVMLERLPILQISNPNVVVEQDQNHVEELQDLDLDQENGNIALESEKKFYKKVGNSFKCVLCKLWNNKYSSYAKFEEHYQRIHTRRLKNPLKCELDGCYKLLYSKKEMNFHKNQCHSNCSNCSSKFGTRKELLRHFKETHKSALFQCKVCSLVYTTAKNLKGHFKRVHIERNDYSIPVKLRKVKLSTPTTVEKSSQVANNTTEFYEDHIESVHHVEIKKNQFETENSYQSQLQQDQDKDQENGNFEFDPEDMTEDIHYKKVGNTFKCVLCRNKKYLTYDIFKDHYQRVHSTRLKNPLKCELDGCYKFLYSKREMNLHKDQCHSNCSKCPAKFGTRLELLRHFREFHESVLFKCKVCSCVYTTSKNLRAHFRRVHIERNDYSTRVKKLRKVKLSTRTFEKPKPDSKSNTTTEFYENQQEITDQDQISFQSPQNKELENEITDCKLKDTIYQKVGSRFKCLLCCKTSHNKYSSYAKFEDHYQRIHTRRLEKPIKCEIDGCSKLLSSKEELNFHKNASHSSCSKCPSNFGTRKELIVHFKASHTKDLFKCHLCSNVYTRINNLRFHLKRIHNEKKKKNDTISTSRSHDVIKTLPKLEESSLETNFQSAIENQEIDQNFTPQSNDHVKSQDHQANTAKNQTEQKRKLVKCDHCLKKIGEKELEFHKYKHEIPDFDFYYNEKSCPVCRKNFADKNSLRRHLMEKHHPTRSGLRYKCSAGCDKYFVNKLYLKRHEKSHTTIFHCPEPNCNMTFKVENTFKCHLNRRHGNIKCSFENCDFHFTSQTTYDKHVENYHGEKVICPICSKLLSKCRLTKHNWLFHREFKCTFEGCSEVFNKEIPFKEHQAGHDPQIKPEFLCTVCGIGKWTKQTLGKHFRSNHLVQLSCPYEDCTRIFPRKYNLDEHIKTHVKRLDKIKK